MSNVIEIALDDDALDMIYDFKHYQGDDSYAIHLAYKIVELYDEQCGDGDEDE